MSLIPPNTSSAMTWTGRVLSALFVLFMIFDIVIKLIMLPVVAETLEGLGWHGSTGLLIGLIELVCLALYVIPRTAVLGAVLMMSVLGGAVASNWRVDKPVFGYDLFGVYLGLFMWGGLWLRDASLRAVFPLKR